MNHDIWDMSKGNEGASGNVRFASYILMENLKFVTWANGYKALNPLDKMATKIFPIGQIWFNDLNNIEKRLSQSKDDPTDTGWMEKLVDSNGPGSIRAKYPNVTINKVNQDCTEDGERGLLAYTGLPSNKFTNIQAIHGPTMDQLQKLFNKKGV